MGKKWFENKIRLSVLILMISILTGGCSGHVRESDITGKTYVYEKEGFGGDFTVQIKDDGTFEYYEGPLSSYIGYGKWSLEDDILCLSEESEDGGPSHNYFKVDGENLVFQAGKSRNFSYVKVSDGEKFSADNQKSEEEKKGEEAGDGQKSEDKEDSRESEEQMKNGQDNASKWKNLTVREYADLLREAGITELTEGDIVQVEGWLEEMPGDVREALEAEQVPAFLLLTIGKGEFDPDTFKWTPSSEQIYCFDTEAFNIEQMYTYFLEGVQAINEGEFEITQIEEKLSKEQTDKGPKSHKIRFSCNGTKYEYDAEVLYDWFDTGILNYMNDVLKKEGISKRLYFMGDGYQECIVLYCTQEWAENFNRLTGCRLMDAAE